MKIALAQLNPTIGAFAANTEHLLGTARRAAEMGAHLAVFPELSTSGYPPADLIEKPEFLAEATAAMDRIVAATLDPAMPAILFGTVLPSSTRPGKHARNVAVLCTGGKVLLVQQKVLLPFYDVFDEQRYFEPGIDQALVELNGEVLAITVCEDAWNDKGFWPDRLYADDPVERLMAKRTPEGKAADVILNLSASPFWGGKPALRRQMLAALAVRHGVPLAIANQVGANDSLLFDGASFALTAVGEICAQAESFQEDLVVFDTAGAPLAEAPLPTDVEADWQALAMGVRDYVHKTGFTSVLVGLSGGIDSALVAALAVEALGAANVLGVGMPSEYSSDHSLEDARALAQNLGIRFEVLPIREGFETMDRTLQPLFAGTGFGLAEENLQSRLRGVLLMAISNKFGALVLTTGNKSEMSTGYCTLYGDMAGALAVIGDVWKTRVYDLAQYANRDREVIPQNTIRKPPSAELRPGQMDTDSLPPYDVLDPLLQAYVERYESAAEIAEAQHLPLERVQQVIALVERSEYKRQQAAPVLKITSKSFGSGRRFPIAARFRP